MNSLSGPLLIGHWNPSELDFQKHPLYTDLDEELDDELDDKLDERVKGKRQVFPFTVKHEISEINKISVKLGWDCPNVLFKSGICNNWEMNSLKQVQSNSVKINSVLAKSRL
jgi:hypothetical protein